MQARLLRTLLCAAVASALAGCTGDGGTVSEGSLYRGTYTAETNDGSQRLVVRPDGAFNGTFTYPALSSSIEVAGAARPDGTFTGTFVSRTPVTGERREAATGTLQLDGRELTLTVHHTGEFDWGTHYFYLRRQ